MDLQSKIGIKIKELREYKQLSQTQLAEIIGYKDKTSIAKIEAGKVDLPQSKIIAFSKALDVTPSYLLDDIVIDSVMGNDEQSTIPRVMQYAKKFNEQSSNLTTPPILQYFEKLNDLGKKEATKRVEELTYLPQYTSTTLLNAAHAYENASEDDKMHDEDIMNDDKFWNSI
jgi:transcriptional regulator with XRE-family HTH domain|nr:MAG TPA: helix-turn-helix domain protein [Caudoviricetes sp.]